MRLGDIYEVPTLCQALVSNQHLYKEFIIRVCVCHLLPILPNSLLRSLCLQEKIIDYFPGVLTPLPRVIFFFFLRERTDETRAKGSSPSFLECPSFYPERKFQPRKWLSWCHIIPSSFSSCPRRWGFGGKRP